MTRAGRGPAGGPSRLQPGHSARIEASPGPAHLLAANPAGGKGARREWLPRPAGFVLYRAKLAGQASRAGFLPRRALAPKRVRLRPFARCDSTPDRADRDPLPAKRRTPGERTEHSLRYRGGD